MVIKAAMDEEISHILGFNSFFKTTLKQFSVYSQ